VLPVSGQSPQENLRAVIAAVQSCRYRVLQPNL
jgi:hypothetical protein